MHKEKGSIGAPRKLDDPVTRSKLLIALAKGKTRSQACEAAGITMRTLRMTEKNDPEFLEQVLDAEETSFDPVEEQIKAMATAGDLGAIKEYRTMKRRREVREARERKLEIESRHVHTIEVEEELRKLLGVLRERERNDALNSDVEVVELSRGAPDDN